MRLGFHLSIAGSLGRAVEQAQVLGCQALQIFIQNPRGWKWRPVAPAAMRDSPGPGVRPGWGPWWNISGISLTWPRLIQPFMLYPPRGCGGNGSGPGPGSRLPGGASRPRAAGGGRLAQVARALALAVSQVPPPPLVLLENTAGQGRELGWCFEHLERIITLSGVPLGLCLDTAHAHGPGMT